MLGRRLKTARALIPIETEWKKTLRESREAVGNAKTALNSAKQSRQSLQDELQRESTNWSCEFSQRTLSDEPVEILLRERLPVVRDAVESVDISLADLREMLSNHSALKEISTGERKRSKESLEVYIEQLSLRARPRILRTGTWGGARGVQPRGESLLRIPQW